MKPYLSAASTVVVLGCGAAPQQVDSAGHSHGTGVWADSETDALEAIRASAENDLHCPRSQIRPWRIVNRSSLWYWYFAEGCGQRATYVQDCSADACRCVLIATVPIATGSNQAR